MSISNNPNGQLLSSESTSLRSNMYADSSFSSVDKLTTENIYKMARDFVKEKEGSKAVQITYDDRNLMNVLTKIISSRNFEEEQSKVGFLDLVGKDRM
jgi:hypothetical protein